MRRVFCRDELEGMTDHNTDTSTDCEALNHILEVLVSMAVDELAVYE